jgi:hypothetical protein
MVLDIQTVHHILKNTAVQNVNKPFVYITDLTSTLNLFHIYYFIIIRGRGAAVGMIKVGRKTLFLLV